MEKIKELVQFLNKHTELYDAGTPLISDKEWDDKYFELQSLENKYNIYLSDSPTQKVHYELMSELKKVKHNHAMLSLDKTKDWDDFVKYFNGHDVVGMLKLDGLTCSLKYENGYLVSAETRGNGEIGEDILHNAKVIPSIPKRINYKEELVVDGEIICTYKDFDSFKELYKNPRNFASGSIRLLDSKECAERHLTFVVWNILKGFDDSNSFLDKLTEVDKLGFTIVPYTSSFDWDAKDFLQDKAKELGYPIDGLVGRFDDILYGNNLGSTGHHSNAAYAFKFYDDEYETELLDIEWTMGRTKILTPVAVFSPVDDGVSVIERASLHNISIMTKILSDPYKYQKIKVAKQNMIIPQVVWADCEVTGERIETPKNCPICGKPTEVIESESGVLNLYCGNPLCGGGIINNIDHYLGKKGLDVKGISKSTIEKLIDWGWVNSVEDIYNLSSYRADWIRKPGFGVASVDKMLTAIENSKNCSLANFISAIGIPLIGSTVSKIIEDNFKTYEIFREKVDDKKFSFANIGGFGYEMNTAIKDFDYEMYDRISKMMKFDSEEKASGDTLGGKIFVITGSSALGSRDKVKGMIEAAGGKVASAVSAKTDYLLANKEESSSKYKNAIKFGTAIINDEDLKKLLNI